MSTQGTCSKCGVSCGYSWGDVSGLCEDCKRWGGILKRRMIIWDLLDKVDKLKTKNRKLTKENKELKDRLDPKHNGSGI